MTINLQLSIGRGLIVIRQLGIDAAVLAILIPAETAVGDGLRAEELKAAQDGFFSGTSRLAEDLDFDQPFVWTKRLGHGCPFPGNV